MKTSILIGISLFFLGCIQGNAELEEKLMEKDSRKSLKSYQNGETVARNLERFFVYIDKHQVNKSFVEELNTNHLFSASDLMVASLVNNKKLDEITILFFLKLYRNNLLGEDYLYNISCCYNNDPILLQLVQNYYKISKNDPTVGLLIHDIYMWVEIQPKNTFSKKIYKELALIKGLLNE